MGEGPQVVRLAAAHGAREDNVESCGDRDLEKGLPVAGIVERTKSVMLTQMRKPTPNGPGEHAPRRELVRRPAFRLRSPDRQRELPICHRGRPHNLHPVAVWETG